jgi:hypothetical protein
MHLSSLPHVGAEEDMHGLKDDRYQARCPGNIVHPDYCMYARLIGRPWTVDTA